MDARRGQFCAFGPPSSSGARTHGHFYLLGGSDVAVNSLDDQVEPLAVPGGVILELDGALAGPTLRTRERERGGLEGGPPESTVASHDEKGRGGAGLTGGGWAPSTLQGASCGVSVYSLILSTATMFVSTSDVIRTSQFSVCVTCRGRFGERVSGPEDARPHGARRSAPSRRRRIDGRFTERKRGGGTPRKVRSGSYGKRVADGEADHAAGDLVLPTHHGEQSREEGEDVADEL